MNNDQNNQEDVANQVYDYAANLIFSEKMSSSETIQILVQKGLSEETSKIVLGNLEKQMKDAKREGANKDMLYGHNYC